MPLRYRTDIVRISYVLKNHTFHFECAFRLNALSSDSVRYLTIQLRYLTSFKLQKLLSSVSVFGFSFTELNALRCAVTHICAQLTNIFSNIPRLHEGVYKHCFIVGFHSDRKPRTKSNLEQQKFSNFFLKAITLSVIGGAVPPVA